MMLEKARVNMLKQQLRACAVLDERILQLLHNTLRENFVPTAYRELAYADFNVPLAHGQVMMTPLEEGQILQALQIKPTDKVLEIGTGSAYLTALLAQLSAKVISLEYYDDFVASAKEKLQQHGLNNVTVIQADGLQGWQVQAPYDIIVITGSVPELPPCFKQQLRRGGRLFAVSGSAPVMEGKLITCTQQGNWQVDKLFTTELAPLIHADEEKSFVF